MGTPRLTGTGIWSSQLRYGEAAEAADAAAELEALGYSALWVPDVGGNVFGAVGNLLAATTAVTVATGILNLWLHTPEETAERHATLTAAHGRRFVVGIGVSHAPLIDRDEPGRYQRPLEQMREYLDALDAAAVPLERDDRILAALGPRMLELARDRAAGVHPYLVTPEHTRLAREAVGPDALVAPEQAVVVSSDPAAAREVGRLHLSTYLGLPNYARNWRRLGFTDDDIVGGGSDRLVDALVASGDVDAIAARVQQHRDAGADHVCLQALTADPRALPRAEWRELAALAATR